MIELVNLNELKNYQPVGGFYNGLTVFVKGHTNLGDGGGGIFMWRTDDIFKTTNPPPSVSPGIYSVDNNGTIIQSQNNLILNDSGRWVRQYDGYINVLYFGAFGTEIVDYSPQIQAAIDFASLNATNYSPIKGSTVFIPNGDYLVSNLTLKTGVSILGESISKTYFNTTNDDNTYLFEIEKGQVYINISNFNINLVGTITEKQIPKGCFHFKSEIGPYGDGGLWYSTFKNIRINNFYGNGIYLETGTSGFITPNQFNIFENVRVFKNNDENFSFFYNALKMTGENGQYSFINCEFNGVKRHNSVKNEYYFDKWHVISIENNSPDIDSYSTSNVITFLNCTIQNSDYGVYINYGENITFDNCWFEDLGVAITINGETVISKSINIINNRFANAAGFGSTVAPNNIKDGQCVSVNKSVANIYNNYVTASYPDLVDAGSSFVLGFPGNSGINLYANTFRDDNKKLSKTYGVMQYIEIESNNSINCKSNKLVFVNKSPNNYIIKNITSSINAGELLTVRANGGQINFISTGGNVFLTNRANFSLQNGEIATFIKIDIGASFETYQLVSFTKSTP